MTDHELLQLILRQQESLTHAVTTQGRTLARLEERIAHVIADATDAKTDRSKLWDAVNKFGLASAWVAYVLFDQRPWERP